MAGTERGIKEPEAVFSACFGAPFMAHFPGVYADILERKIKEHQVQCWLVNTGWTGGPYGVGQRMKIAWTRTLLHAALDGKLNNAEYVQARKLARLFHENFRPYMGKLSLEIEQSGPRPV